jgi:hypothetical protein
MEGLPPADSEGNLLAIGHRLGTDRSVGRSADLVMGA